MRIPVSMERPVAEKEPLGDKRNDVPVLVVGDDIVRLEIIQDLHELEAVHGVRFHKHLFDTCARPVEPETIRVRETELAFAFSLDCLTSRPTKPIHRLLPSR